MTDAPDRRREYTWTDPQQIVDVAPETTGIEFLRRMLAGDVPTPPIASTLDFALIEADDRRVTVRAVPAVWAYNAVGSVHGGVIATWCDTAIGYSIQTTLRPGFSMTTLDLQVRYLKKIVVATGPVRITATTDHAGRSTGSAHAEVRDEAGALLATATSTCLILSPRE